jgi:hypothetical protein
MGKWSHLGANNIDPLVDLGSLGGIWTIESKLILRKISANSEWLTDARLIWQLKHWELASQRFLNDGSVLLLIHGH